AVPALRSATVKRVWAGLRPGTPDELPILGADGRVENLFHATGGFRTGIVATPLTAELVASAVLGPAPPLPIEPFLAARFAERPADAPRRACARGPAEGLRVPVSSGFPTRTSRRSGRRSS